MELPDCNSGARVASLISVCIYLGHLMNDWLCIRLKLMKGKVGRQGPPVLSNAEWAAERLPFGLKTLLYPFLDQSHIYRFNICSMLPEGERVHLRLSCRSAEDGSREEGIECGGWVCFPAWIYSAKFCCRLIFGTSLANLQLSTTLRWWPNTPETTNHPAQFIPSRDTKPKAMAWDGVRVPALQVTWQRETARVPSTCGNHGLVH